jgi:hypothetical protein
MKTLWGEQSTRATGFAALLLALFLGYAGNAAAQTPCMPSPSCVPTMTIKIFNNSDTYNIYPVLSSGTAVTDLFLQAALMVPKLQLPNNPFPKLNQFRLYINPTGDGIPAGGNVTITLPFYTQLIPTILLNPKCPTNPATPNCPDQFIDWWGGGRIEFFKNLKTAHQPPAALTADYTGTNLPPRGCQVKCDNSPVPSACTTSFAKFQCKPIASAALPTCPTCQPLQIFKDSAGLKNNEPSQLTEYTLSAINQNKDPFGLDLHNVDYDVSYVDTAFMPVAMEPVNNIQVGYIGMITSIETFRASLMKFTMPSSPWTGWPQFKDDQGVTILKIPSALHIFAGDPDMTPPGPSPPGPPPPPYPWTPINTLADLWQICVTENGTAPICPSMRDVNALFGANYRNYVATYTMPSFGCNSDKMHPNPVTLTRALKLRSVHGWSPFNDNCTNAQGNLLENTPGYFMDEIINGKPVRTFARYQAVKEEFDRLQYWPDEVGGNLLKGRFNPYGVLIHGADYINAPYVYAYSVDDAVGNMQVAGDGLILAVGGVNGLPNPNHATPFINVSFGYAPKPINLVQFTKYGVCKTPPDTAVNPDFPSFIISSTNPNSCPLSWVDNAPIAHQYTFKLKYQPVPPKPPAPQTPPWVVCNPGDTTCATALNPAARAPIDCSDNPPGSPGATWCTTSVFAYAQLQAKRKHYYAITGAPQQ